MRGVRLRGQRGVGPVDSPRSAGAAGWQRSPPAGKGRGSRSHGTPGGGDARAADHRAGVGVPDRFPRFDHQGAGLHGRRRARHGAGTGRPRLHENKLARFLKREVRPAHPEEVSALTGAEVGFVGPVGLPADGKLRICGRREPASRRSGGQRGRWGAPGAARVRHRREQGAHASGRRGGRTRFLRRICRSARGRRGRRLPRVRPPPGDRAGDRGREHLQVGHQVLAASRGDHP